MPRYKITNLIHRTKLKDKDAISKEFIIDTDSADLIYRASKN